MIFTGGEEVRHIPFEEDFESVDENKQGSPESAPIRNVWLKAVVVDIFFEVESLS